MPPTRLEASAATVIIRPDKITGVGRYANYLKAGMTSRANSSTERAASA
jgi:hypothetical protein